MLFLSFIVDITHSLTEYIPSTLTHPVHLFFSTLTRLFLQYSYTYVISSVLFHISSVGPTLSYLSSSIQTRLYLQYSHMLISSVLRHVYLFSTLLCFISSVLSCPYEFAIILIHIYQITCVRSDF